MTEDPTNVSSAINIVLPQIEALSRHSSPDRLETQHSPTRQPEVHRFKLKHKPPSLSLKQTKSRCKSVNIKKRHAIEPKNLEKLIVWEKQKEKDAAASKITPQEEKIMKTLQFKANLSNSAQRRGSRLADRSSQLESYEYNSNKKFYVEQHKVRLMKPHESFRQRSVSKKGMVSNASIITLKLEEENVNPEVSKTFADRLKSLSSNLQSSDISPSHSVKGRRFKGNFKLALSKQKKSFYRSYYQKVSQGEELSEDMKRTFQEFKRIDKTEGAQKEKERLNEPLGIFNTNVSFQNSRVPSQGVQPSRPYSSQETYRFNFRRKLINSLIKKIATSDDESEVDDPYELKDVQLRRYETENSLQQSPSSRQPMVVREFSSSRKPRVHNIFEKESVYESIQELPLSSVSFAEDYSTEEKKIENNSPSPSRLEEKYSTATIPTKEKQLNKIQQSTRRNRPGFGKSPERRAYFPKQASVLFGNRYVRKKETESQIFSYNSDLMQQPVLKMKKDYSLRTQSALQKPELLSYKPQEPERCSFTAQHSHRRSNAKQSLKIVQRPVVMNPRNDTASLLTLFLQQRKISMQRGEQQGRRVQPLGASRINNCLKIQNLRQRSSTICEYKM